MLFATSTINSGPGALEGSDNASELFYAGTG